MYVIRMAIKANDDNEKPNMTLFSAAEMAVVDKILVETAELSDAAVRVLVQEECGWRLAQIGEHVPYGTALLAKKPLPLTAKEMEMAQVVAKRISEDNA